MNLVNREQAYFRASIRGVARHKHQHGQCNYTSKAAQDNASHAQNKFVSGFLICLCLYGIRIRIWVAGVHGQDHVILIVFIGIPYLQERGRIGRNRGHVGLHTDGISRHKEVFPGAYYVLHGLIRHIGRYLCNPLVTCILNTEIQVGVVLYVIIIYGVIFTQMNQYIEGQILHGHPWSISCIRIHKIRIIALEIHRYLFLVIVHGNRRAGQLEILIQIISPGLDVAHNPVQSPLRPLLPRSIADPYNDLVHIQLSVSLKHILITHIGKYAVDILCQLFIKLGRILICILVYPLHTFSVIGIKVHGADPEYGHGHKDNVEQGQKQFPPSEFPLLICHTTTYCFSIL